MMKEGIAVERRDSMDIALLRSLRDVTVLLGDPERFWDLISLFLDSVQTDVHCIRRCFAERDAAAVREVARELKGTSAKLGAACLAALCGVLEEACRDPQMVGVECLVREIESQAQKVRQIMLWEAQCICQ